jgi:transglutaminase-like putative cysteine protease/predicted glutamine amidotransferase
MPNLFAMSFEGELAPSFDLRCLRAHGRLPDGWGIGFYPAGEPCAQVLKEPAPSGESIRSEVVRAWQHLESSVFVLHVRTATWGKNTDANTQPFARSHGGRDWVFGHAGSLERRIALSAPRFHEPVGSTDTELVFCEILNRLVTAGWRTLGDAEPETLRVWLDEINDLGSLSLVLTDGRDLLVYADRSGRGELHLWQLLPPYGSVVFGDRDLEIDLTRREQISRKGIIISSTPLEPMTEEEPTIPKWRKLQPGEMVIVRQGAIRTSLAPAQAKRAPSASVSRIVPVRPVVATPHRFRVRHRTVYRYDKPVERSTHLFRLEPVHDRLQRLEAHELDISVDGDTRTYDDVFGNRVRKVEVDTPFKELVIESRSSVQVLDTNPLEFGTVHERSTIPLVWMPWQAHMLQPFLLPPELPESQLRELAAYAMTFVERNDYDLLDTLLDINGTIFKEYAYRPAETTLNTTAFDVYTERRGVCQDFTNLFICLARLLGVPARYACGYVFTGKKHPNSRMGDATHAWVQVYLPVVGWRGFDPTNGTVTQTDHVRVAVGRSYIDATPTSGVLWVGGGAETLDVAVRVDLADADD